MAYFKYTCSNTSDFVDVDDIQKQNHYEDKKRKAQGWHIVTGPDGAARIYDMPSSAKVAAAKAVTTNATDAKALALKKLKAGKNN